MARNRHELLKFLKIESETAELAHVAELEKWYLEHISKELLYDVFVTTDRKLTLLNRHITEYFNSVAMIPPSKSADEFVHLDGMSAIQYASKKGYDVYLESALKENPGAVNQTTKAKLTPLHLAALYGHPISSSLLLKHNASLKLESKLGQIPLEYALILMPSYEAHNLKARKLQIVEAFVAAYPKGIHHRDAHENTLAHHAVENNFASVIERLIKDHPRILGLSNSSGHTPLHTALLNKREECVHLLIHMEALLALADKEGRLPIHYAAMYSNSALLDPVMAPKQLNALDTNSRTPVMLAAQQGNLDNVMLLVKNNANISLTDQYGQNLFHHAVMSLNLELVQWLVENAAININLQDDNGRTPLMNLLNEDNLSCSDTQTLVDYLVEVSSKEEAVDRYGKSLNDYLPDERLGKTMS